MTWLVLTAVLVAATPAGRAAAGTPADPIDPAATVTTLTAPISTLRVGEVLPMRVEVGGAAPTGSVTILDDVTPVASGDLADGVADIPVKDLTLGHHDLLAQYGGDGANAPSASSPVSIDVVKWAAEVVVLTPDVVEVGTTVSVPVAVLSDGPFGTGTITLQHFGRVVGSATLNSGRALLELDADEVDEIGSPVTAVFSGDDELEAASGGSTLTVARRTSSTAVDFLPSAYVDAGGALQVRVRVGVAKGPAPTGSVTLTGPVSVSAPLDSSGTAVFDLSGQLPVGSTTIGARYDGDDLTAPSAGAEVLVVRRLDTTLAATVTPGTYGTSARIAVVAGGGTVALTGSVRVSLSGVTMATASLSGGRATLVLPATWPPGTRTLNLTYDGDDTHAGVSRTVTVVVGKAATTATASTAPIAYGGAAVVHVAVRGAGSTPSGTVRVMRGSTVLGSADLANGTASIRLPRLDPGSYPITVSYSGSVLHRSSTVGLVQAVVRATPTLTASYSGTGTAAGPHRLSVTLRGAGVAPGGRVTISRSGRVVATATLAGQVTTVIGLGSLGAGSYAFTVGYSGDSRYAPTSTTVSVTVTRVTPFGDGMFRVGTDVVPGLYRVKVPAGSLCYWERRSDATDSFAGLTENEIEHGYGLVRILPSDRYVKSDDCGTWQPVAASPNWPFLGRSIPGNGAFVVGRDISPGTYHQTQKGCYIELLSDATGGLDAIIDNDLTSGPSYITISSSVFAIRTSSCSTWTRA